MCHFLTVSIPLRSIPEVPDEFRREIHFVEHGNPSVTDLAPFNWISFAVVSKGCSCGLYRTGIHSKGDTLKRIASYRKKRWSDAKIRRAIASRPSIPQKMGLRDDIRDLISQLVMEAGHLRLSLHWYSGNIETEEFHLNDLGSISLEDFRHNTSILRSETTVNIHQTKETFLE